MPKLLRSSETAGCGATIELDNGEVVYVSIAQIGVGVAQPDPDDLDEWEDDLQITDGSATFRGPPS